MFSRQRLKLFFISLDGPTIGTALALFLLFGLLFFRLNTLIPVFSPAEKHLLVQSSSLGNILSNPVNAPYKLVEYSAIYLHHQNLFVARSVSVLFAILAILLFFYVAKNWHSDKVALMATIILATSSWLLHYARQATPDILLTLSLAVLAYGVWVKKASNSALAMLFGVGIAATLLYIPGLCLLALIGIIWQRRTIIEHIKNGKLSLVPLMLIGIVFLAPLVVALIKQPNLARQLVGLPTKLPRPYDYFRHTANIPYQLFIKRPPDPFTWLGKLPLLDFFTSIMVILGLYTYRRLKLDRAKILVGLVVFGSLLAGLRGSVPLIIIMPAIYLLAAAGLEYLLKQWLTVYPRNPLARILGYSLIIIAVGLVTLYSLRSYYVAWPQAPATKQAFQLHT